MTAISNIERHQICNSVPARAGVKNLIAIGSGKGGVGKSTTCVNLALALATLGLKVGVMDADIYGPSIALMLGCQQRPQSLDGNTMQAHFLHGVYFNSMGNILADTDALIWRGPLLTRTLLQLWQETHWGELDILLIDMPPGTGDVHLTVAQKLPLTAAMVLTTPQNVALLDARRALLLFKELNVPTLGVIENMSTWQCAACGHRQAIFGSDGAQNLAAQFNLPLLAQIPLDSHIRQAADSGASFIEQMPQSAASAAYLDLALAMLDALGQLPLLKKNPLADIGIKVEPPTPR